MRQITATSPVGERSADGSEAEEGEIRGGAPGLAVPDHTAQAGDAAEGAQGSSSPLVTNQASSSSLRRGNGTDKKKHKKKDAAVELELVWRPGSSPLRLGDIQALVLWALADGQAPRWCRIKPKSGLRKVVLLVAHGIDAAMWEAHGASSAATLSRQFGPHPTVLQARNATLVPAQTVHALLTLPASKKRPREVGEKQRQLPSLDAANGPAEPSAAPDTADSPRPWMKRLRAAGDTDVGAHHAAHLAPVALAPPAAGAGASLSALRRLPPGEEGEVVPGDLPPLSSYALTLDQLEACGYPLPQCAPSGELVCPEGFVATRAQRAGSPPPPHPLVALDCEMCATAEGLGLARCTVVDGQGRVLLDMLVRPRSPIVDYCTQYSGISEETLAGVATTVEDAQAAFRAVVSAETLVVTHSGENDFKALKVIHANVVDTSVLYPHPRGPPARPALRVLASRFLRRGIQGGGGGHDPVEDARAALDLALLKAARGPAFGQGSGERGEKLAEVLAAAGRRGSLVGDLAVVSRYVGGSLSAVLADGDAQAAEKAAREAASPTADFVWAQLTGVQRMHEQRVAALKEAAQAAPCLSPGVYYTGPQWAEREAAALAAVDSAIAGVYAAAPPGTLVIVATGQGDTSYQAYLEQRRYERRAGEADGAAAGGPAGWSVADEEAMRTHADRAVTALCFVGVKR